MRDPVKTRVRKDVVWHKRDGKLTPFVRAQAVMKLALALRAVADQCEEARQVLAQFRKDFPELKLEATDEVDEAGRDNAAANPA